MEELKVEEQPYKDEDMVGDSFFFRFFRIDFFSACVNAFSLSHTSCRILEVTWSCGLHGGPFAVGVGCSTYCIHPSSTQCKEACNVVVRRRSHSIRNEHSAKRVCRN